MSLDWQKKVLDLSKVLKPDPITKDKVLEIVRKYEDKSKVNKVQLELMLNIRIENHDQFVALHNNALVCSLDSVMYAVQENLLAIVQVLIKQNPTLINFLDSHGNTPIHHALKLGHEDIAEFLINQPANFEINDGEGNTILHSAAQSKLYLLFISLMARYGEKKIFVKNTLGDNCLHVALRSGSNEIVSYIFKAVRNIDYTILGFNSNTYLHYASIGNCNENILKHLISKTSNINCLNLLQCTPMHEALLNGSKTAARTLFDHGSDITLVGVFNENCYHFAAQGNCYKMIDALAAIKNNINEKSDLGLTPLHMALAESRVATIEKLIENDAKLDVVDRKGNSIFHYIAKKNLSNLIKYLDTNSPLLDQQNISGFTPLHLSVQNNSYLVFKFLIENQVNANKYCLEMNNTALHTAAIVGNWCYVYGLLINGANPDATNKDGNTPIQLALMHDNLDCVEILLLYADNIHDHFCKKGNGVLHYATKHPPEIITKIINANNLCSLDTVNKFSRDTLYHSAIEYKNLEMIEFLVSQNVPQEANALEVIPLHLAAELGNVKIFKTLADQLDAEEMKLKDVKGKSVLHYIISSGNKEIFDHFKDRLTRMAKPLDLSEPQDKQYALHYAVKRGRLDVMHTLLSDERLVEVINTLDEDGFAPLHYAVKFGSLETVECLIGFGSDKDVVSEIEFQTPLHRAVIYNKIEIVKYLVEIGANINAQCNKGYAAIHLAVVYGFEDILTYLIQKHASTKLNTYDEKFNPLLLATVLNRVNMMKYLMECDGDMPMVYAYIKAILPVVALNAGSHDALEYIKNYEGPNYDVIKLLSKDVDEIL